MTYSNAYGVKTQPLANDPHAGPSTIQPKNQSTTILQHVEMALQHINLYKQSGSGSFNKKILTDIENYVAAAKIEDRLKHVLMSDTTLDEDIKKGTLVANAPHVISSEKDIDKYNLSDAVNVFRFSLSYDLKVYEGTIFSMGTTLASGTVLPRDWELPKSTRYLLLKDNKDPDYTRMTYETCEELVEKGKWGNGPIVNSILTIPALLVEDVPIPANAQATLKQGTLWRWGGQLVLQPPTRKHLLEEALEKMRQQILAAIIHPEAN